MDILCGRFGQPENLYPFQFQVVRGIRIKHAIAEDDAKTLQIAKRRVVISIEQSSLRSGDRVQGVRRGEPPVLIASTGKAHRFQSFKGGAARIRRPGTAVR